MCVYLCINAIYTYTYTHYICVCIYIYLYITCVEIRGQCGESCSPCTLFEFEAGSPVCLCPLG